MIVILLAFMVLLLSAAVIVLFAMLGELYTRVGPPADTAPRPLTEANIGQRPAAWPIELERLATADDTILLVLSSACGSCAQVATQLREQTKPLGDHEMGVVLSTADAESADVFLREHELPRDSVYVDVGGKWLVDAFGVQTSPSALVLRAGRLSSALAFTDVAALRTALAADEEKEAV